MAGQLASIYVIPVILVPLPFDDHALVAFNWLLRPQAKAASPHR